MSAPDSFNLLHQAWIKLLDRHGTVHEVSILDAFEHADKHTDLVGEIPTQSVAILRFMEAIMYRALRHDLNNDEAREQWSQWWNEGLPVDRIRDYLLRYEDRFDLLHPTMPFYQVADLASNSGATSGLTKLVAEIPDGELFFSTRAGQGLDQIGLAEATRWVISVMAFDISGIKTGALGDDRVKGGKGYPIGTGWAGNLGIVYAVGSNLAQTLLLNMVHDQSSKPEDAPPWERAPLGAAVDSGHEAPRGIVDLLTWQSRRLRLFTNEQGAVVDAMISNGDRITAQNRHRLETMTGWRRSANQEKSGEYGPVVYMPRRHQSDWFIWRGLGPLLAAPGVQDGIREEAQQLLPEILDWISRLNADDYIPHQHHVRLHIFGVEYGSQNSSIEALIDDAMSLQVATLADPLLRQVVINAVESTGIAVRALRDLAKNLAVAGGNENDGVRDRASEVIWNQLDHPFRAWAARLASVEADEALSDWHAQAYKIVRQLGDELIESAGEKAWKGREISSRSGGTMTMNSALADLWFRRGLGKALDRAFKESADEPGEST